MAGEKYHLVVNAREPLWALMLEFASAVPTGSWILVGGLMTQVHALRAGVAASRQTTDIDALLNLQVASISEVAGPIQRLGFVPRVPGLGGQFHRFARGDDIIDVMVGREIRTPVRWAGRQVFQAAGAAQAVVRVDEYVLSIGDQEASILVPDSVGAVIAKSAAHLGDRIDRARHLEDLIALLASTPRDAFLRVELSKKDIRYLRHLVAELEDVTQVSWLALKDTDNNRARSVLDTIRMRCG